MSTRFAPAHRSERNSPEIEAAFQAVPREQIAEIINGELVVSPRPARPHTSVASRLGFLLGPSFMLGNGGPGGWVILFEPELHVGPRPDKLVPDFAGWRRARLPDAYGGDIAPAYYDLAPDWVCEVLSASTEADDRADKMPIYAREGVKHAWLVNPIVQTVEVFRLENDVWQLVTTYRSQAKIRAAPFDAVELDLSQLWAR